MERAKLEELAVELIVLLGSRGKIAGEITVRNALDSLSDEDAATLREIWNEKMDELLTDADALKARLVTAQDPTERVLEEATVEDTIARLRRQRVGLE